MERIVVELSPQVHVVTVVNGHVDDADPWLRQRGFELIRLSKRQIENEPARVAAVLRDRLSRAAA